MKNLDTGKSRQENAKMQELLAYLTQIGAKHTPHPDNPHIYEAQDRLAFQAFLSYQGFYYDSLTLDNKVLLYVDFNQTTFTIKFYEPSPKTQTAQAPKPKRWVDFLKWY